MNKKIGENKIKREELLRHLRSVLPEVWKESARATSWGSAEGNCQWSPETPVEQYGESPTRSPNESRPGRSVRGHPTWLRNPERHSCHRPRRRSHSPSPHRSLYRAVIPLGTTTLRREMRFSGYRCPPNPQIEKDRAMRRDSGTRDRLRRHEELFVEVFSSP